MRFDQKASSYHGKASIQKLVADWCSEWIEDDCAKYTGLELGAGTGLFTKHLAFRGFNCLSATDNSNPMLEEGESRIPSVNWEKQDAWNLASRKVDRIYACSLLQWAPDPVQVLKNWRDTLTTNGRILACIFVKGSLIEFTRKDERFSAFSWWSDFEWVDFFRDSGMKILRDETRTDVVSYPSAREALRHIHDIGATKKGGMSPGELKRFLISCENREETQFNLSWRTLRIESALRE